MPLDKRLRKTNTRARTHLPNAALTCRKNASWLARLQNSRVKFLEQIKKEYLEWKIPVKRLAVEIKQRPGISQSPAYDL